MNGVKAFIFKWKDLIEKLLWGAFPTIYWKTIHESAVTAINRSTGNILSNNPVFYVLYSFLITCVCLLFAYFIPRLAKSKLIPSPNIFINQQNYNEFLTSLKDELKNMSGINKGHIRSFRFSIYRELRDFPKKGKTQIYCCARINNHNGDLTQPRVWKMSNNSNGKNAGIVGLALARGETLHLAPGK